MWVPRQDEGIDAQRGVLAEARGDSFGVANEGRTRTMSNQADARLQIGRDLQSLA